MSEVTKIAKSAALRLWSAAPSNARRRAHPSPANGLVVAEESPDRARLSIADWLEPHHAGGAAWVWEPSTSRLVGAVWSKEHYGYISDGAFTRDGRALIAAAQQGGLAAIHV